MIARNAFAVVLGAASLALLLALLAIAHERSRRHRADLLSQVPLARYAFTAAQWRAFLRVERRKHARGVAFVAGVTAVTAAIAWATCLGTGAPAAEPPAVVAGACAALVAALAVERLVAKHYMRWMLRRGDVAIYPFGVAISGVLLDWATRDDLRLRRVRVCGGGALELLLERGTVGGQAESWIHEVFWLPLPPDVDAAAIAGRLICMPGSEGV